LTKYTGRLAMKCVSSNSLIRRSPVFIETGLERRLTL